ncbi:MAG: Crp/Fnr family transcriptional regulator [Gammaproteobacteria bacterium]|nr:MAG: Crp/Fnr family transcriptional regulator [Gammaproteobacteria bacterium]
MTGKWPTSRRFRPVDGAAQADEHRGPVLRERANRILRRDEHLFHTGDTVHQTYLVVAGFLKSYVLHENGEEQILDFHQPGDVVGIEAMFGQPICGSVVALDTSSVRTLSLPDPAETFVSRQSDATLMLASMHRAMRRLTERLHMVVHPTGQRLARYLLEFADAQARRGCSRRELRLPMRRRDLASYLGLATETLSRTFTRLQQQGLIKVANHEVTLLDTPGLRRMAGLDVEKPHAVRHAGQTVADTGHGRRSQPHDGNRSRVHSLPPDDTPSTGTISRQ